MLCLIVYQGCVFPDVCIYHAATDTFNTPNLIARQASGKAVYDICDLKHKRAEIDAWICKNRLPLPNWQFTKREV